jgi:hypothetical protein
MRNNLHRAIAQPPSSPASITFAVTTFKQRDQWSRKTARDRRVKLMHRHVLRSLALCTRTDKDGRLVIDPTYNELAKASACCERTAMRAITVAEEIGIIRKARHSDGRMSNAFELLLPAVNGVKNADEAPEKTQESQRPTVTNFAAAEGVNPDSAVRVLRVKRKVVMREKNNKLNTRERAFRPALSERVPTLPRVAHVTDNGKTTADDATADSAKGTPRAAVVFLPQQAPPMGGLVSNKINESKPTNSFSNGSHLFKTAAADEIGNGRELRNGQAARRSEHEPRNPLKEIRMTTILPDDEYFERFFQALLAKYPRRDAAECARAALRDVLDAAADPAQLRSCLMDGVERYEHKMRAAASHLFMSLAAFIADGKHWRPEYLEFNRVAA